MIRNISEAINAPFLDGISEIDANIIELGAGSANEKNVIYIPATTFKPEVLFNNTTYPLSVVQYDDTTLLVTLDKMETIPTSVTDDQVIGAAYDRIDTTTKTHTEAILESKFTKAIHALAPSSDSANTPVLQTTGDVFNGRRRLVYEDLVHAAATAKGLGWRMALSTDHWNDLLLDRKNFGNQMVDYAEGKPAPKICGFELSKFDQNPLFGGTNKIAFGAAATTGQFEASVFFRKDNVGKKTGLTKQYYSPAIIKPENPVNTLNYRHYYICLPLQQKFIGAIASAAA